MGFNSGSFLPPWRVVGVGFESWALSRVCLVSVVSFGSSWRGVRLAGGGGEANHEIYRKKGNRMSIGVVGA